MTPPGPRGPAWSRHPVAVAIAATVALMVVTLALDPAGYLGTDTGGKVATLEAMSRQDSWTPDVGYWAEDLDPTGHHHPLFQTRRADDSWIQVTTLPMIYASKPLYDLGGYRLALLFPIAGTVLAALAARALAARLGSPRPDLVFWIFVFASPLVVYALDLWEHSMGVALLLWAFVALVGVLQGRSCWWSVAAGSAMAGAASMRTEALVYAFLMVLLVGATMLLRRRMGEAVLTGAGAIAGFVPVWLLNSWAEDRLGAPSRSGRALGAAEAGVATSEGPDDGLLVRLREGIETLLSVRADDTAASILLGAVIAVTIAVVLRFSDRFPHRVVVGSSALIAVVYLLVVSSGLGFVNGLLAAFPIAAAGFAFDHRDPVEVVTVGVAVLGLPLVWAFQFLGGAGPQWGGRYVLTSGALLGVVGAKALFEASTPQVLRRTVVGASLAVSVFGVAWLVERSNDVAEAFEAIEAVEVDGLVARNPFILREGGDASLGERWLSVNIGDNGRIEGALRVFEEAGVSTVGVLQAAGVRPEPGLDELARVPIDFLGVAFEIVVYELEPSSRD